MPHPLVTLAGRFDHSAIMRAAIALCWTNRTEAAGIGTANIEFPTVRVFDRSHLSMALRSVWRQARRERLKWQLAQPEAIPRAEALEAATRLRWAAEAASVRADIEAATRPLPEPFRLAA